MLAQTAARLGALDSRLKHGPEGWRHRLALLEASELSWQAGRRVTPDRLGLWHSLRLHHAGTDTAHLQQAGWAYRRLTSAMDPREDLLRFLDRQESDALGEKAQAYAEVLNAATALHPIIRAAFAYRLWPLAGIGLPGETFEGAVIAARLGAQDGQGGALFLPVLGGGPAGLRGGDVSERVRLWLQAATDGLARALRHLDDLGAWETRARTATAHLSGRTPPRLIEVLRDWPLVTAPMAEQLTGASRAAVQRNLHIFETEGVIREVTGQGRFRLWRAAI